MRSTRDFITFTSTSTSLRQRLCVTLRSKGNLHTLKDCVMRYPYTSQKPAETRNSRNSTLHRTYYINFRKAAASMLRCGMLRHSIEKQFKNSWKWKLSPPHTIHPIFIPPPTHTGKIFQKSPGSSLLYVLYLIKNSLCFEALYKLHSRIVFTSQNENSTVEAKEWGARSCVPCREREGWVVGRTEF